MKHSHPTAPEKENHLIEAIVFTTDFLSCVKPSAAATRGSSWFCGSVFAEAEHPYHSGNNDNDDEGWFGMRRKQLISYEDAEDLTRKVDALFHRTRSNNSTGSSTESVVTPEIRDDDPGRPEDDENHHHTVNASEYHRPHERRNRRIEVNTASSTTTNHSRTQSAMSQEELQRWYSSSWYSYTYHGNRQHDDGQPNDLTTKPSRRISRDGSSRALGTASNRRGGAPREPRPARQHPRDPSRRNHHHRNRTTSDSRKRSSSSSELPEFLRGGEFKSSRMRAHPFPVISLPANEASFPPPSGEGRRTGDTNTALVVRSGRGSSAIESGVVAAKSDLRMNTAEANEETDHCDYPHGLRGSTAARVRRCRRCCHWLGRKTRDFWNKTRRTLRR